MTEATVTFTNGATEQTKTKRRGPDGSLPPTLLASRARDTGRGRDEIASTIFKRSGARESRSGLSLCRRPTAAARAR